MNIFDTKSSVLIIGNGFDLNCGLKTRFENVYAEYVLTDSESKVIEELKHNISKDIKTWADFEMEMARYAKRLSSEDELIECVNDFNQFMQKYLLRIQKEFHDSFDKLITSDGVKSEMRRSINSLGKEITHDLSALMERRNAESFYNLAILSFNYTDIFDSIYSRYYSREESIKVTHIHGRLSDETILGVDNDVQLSVPYTLTSKGRRCFVKPFFNNEFDSARTSYAKSLIMQAKTIFVYGASLGDSDLTWRNQLIEWLNRDKDNHLFIYNHDLSKISYKTKQDRSNKEEDAKKVLIRNWNIENPSGIFNQIHMPISINIFNFESELLKDKEISDHLREERSKKAKELQNDKKSSKTAPPLNYP